MFARELGVGVDLRKELRSRDAGHCQRLTRARLGDAQVRAARQRFVDQPVELRIVQRFPPVALRPRRSGGRAGKRALGGQLRCAVLLGLRRQSGGARASADQRSRADENRDARNVGIHAMTRARP
jgi:hypothetical protein